MHVSGSMYSISAVANSGWLGVGLMQSTGQAATQLASLQHRWVITKVIGVSLVVTSGGL